MFEYPMEKYHFYTCNDRLTGVPSVIAVSTYEGRTVKGVAKCDPKDSYDLEKGKELAAARCNAKIAARRTRRANRELQKAYDAYNKALKHVNAMNDYLNDSRLAERDAIMHVEGILQKM